MYLGAKCGLFMKKALHKITVLPGCDFTSAEKIYYKSLLRLYALSASLCSSPLPSFGSNAAWPACDHTVYVWQVCVISTAMFGADLKEDRKYL